MNNLFVFQVCLETEEAVAIVIVLFRGHLSEDLRAANQTLDYISALRRRHSHSKLTVIPVDDDFARALALQIGTAYVPNDDSNILFYVDVDMVFTRATLERIRRNTIRGKQVKNIPKKGNSPTHVCSQVYFPVVYSEFDPSVVYGEDSEMPSHFAITPDSGYWRQYGFGIASAYRMDVDAAGGFNTAIRGWGKEDVDLFDRSLIKRSVNCSHRFSFHFCLQLHLIEIFNLFPKTRFYFEIRMNSPI